MRMFRSKPQRSGKKRLLAAAIALEPLEERLAPALFPETADLANNLFSGAEPITLEILRQNDTIVGGTTIIEGSIAGQADVDLYRFTAPADLPHALAVTAELAATGVGGSLDSLLSVFDAARDLITSNDDSLEANGVLSFDSRFTFAVEAGQTYFLQAAAFFGTLGGYRLTLTVPPTQDDFGNDAATAQDIVVPAHGLGLSGAIESPGDVDVFRFVAPTSGFLRISQGAASGSALDSLLGVRDASGAILAQNDDANKSGSRDSAVQVPVSAGEQYFIHAGGFAGSTGAYHLNVLIDSTIADDFANDFAGAAAIALDGQGMGSQAGRLESFGDVDRFRFVAPFSGQFSVSQRAFPSSELDSFLRVFDAGENLVAENDDIDPTVVFDSLVSFTATAGQTYFIEAGSYQGQTGATDLGIGVGDYVVSVRPDPIRADSFGDTPATATTIALSGGAGVWTAQQSGVIDVPGDVDVFRFVAPTAGTAILAQTAGPDGQIDSFLAVFDAAGNILAQNNDSGSSHGFAKFRVEARQELFVRAAGTAFGPTGSYDLSLRIQSGGLAITDMNHSVTAVGMVQELLGGGTATTVQLTGGTVAAIEQGGLIVLADSIGYFGAPAAAGVFAGGAGILDTRNPDRAIEHGIVLSTGSAVDLIGPNYRDNTTTDHFAEPNRLRLDPANPLHQQILRAVAGLEGTETYDGTALFFQFVPDPAVGVVEFDFVFGSEEYNEFVLSGFNDVFGFFVNGINYARLGANTHIAGSGDLVSIDTVNLGSHSDRFINNSMFPTAPFGIVNVELDGLTTVLTVRAPVLVGQVNTIVIGITDVKDGQYDSAVFLSGGSFRTATDPIRGTPNAIVAQQLAQRLTTLVANNANVAATDVEFHYLLQQILVNEALKGLDLTSGFLIIPVDPVDFTLAAPSGGEFTGTGQIPNVPNAFFTSTNNGANDFLIIAHPRPGDYQLTLAGAGTGDFRWGASYVSPFGDVTSVLVQGRLQPGGGAATLGFSIGANLGDPRFLAGTLAQARTGLIGEATHFVTLTPGAAIEPGSVGVALVVEGIGRAQSLLSSVFASGALLTGETGASSAREAGGEAAQRDGRQRDVAGDSGLAGPSGGGSDLPDVLDAVLQSTRDSVVDMIDATFESLGWEPGRAAGLPLTDVLMPLFETYWPGLSLPPEIFRQLQNLPAPSPAPAQPQTSTEQPERSDTTGVSSPRIDSETPAAKAATADVSPAALALLLGFGLGESRRSTGACKGRPLGALTTNAL